jgi:hypothetical protein
LATHDTRSTLRAGAWDFLDGFGSRSTATPLAEGAIGLHEIKGALVKIN